MTPAEVCRVVMTENRRGTTWWVAYSFNGKQRCESSKSLLRSDAVKLLRRRQAEMGSGKFIGPDAERLTVAGLFDMVVSDYALNARKSVPPLHHLRAYFPERMKALDLTTDRAAEYARVRLDAGAAPATVKLELRMLARGLNLALRAGRLPHVPYIAMPKVSNARRGFFTDAEVAALLPHLPDHMRPFIEAAYITGWRRSELLGLRWAQVDWETGTMRLERGTTKSGEPRTFPFRAHERLTELLHELREQATTAERETGRLVPWVFPYRGGQFKGCYSFAWHEGCRKAGLTGRLVHDLRRSAVRNLVRAGVSEAVAMTLSGHKTRDVFDRYNITSASDQLEAVRKLNALRAPEPGRVVPLRKRAQ